MYGDCGPSVSFKILNKALKSFLSITVCAAKEILDHHSFFLVFSIPPEM